MPLLVRPDGQATGVLPGEVDLAGLARVAEHLVLLGLGGVKLFVSGHDRDATATGALALDNRMVRAINEIKCAAPDLAVTTEVCGCSWTTSHECVLRDNDGRIDLDNTYELMGHMALLHAQAGADAVSPTAMLDGTIREVRAALDAEGWRDVSVNPNIAVAGALYGPFKALMDTNPESGHRRGLQLDPARVVPGVIQCAESWLTEGADSLTLQPVMTNTDALAALADLTFAPVTAYSTSGEWEALRQLPRSALLDYHRMLLRLGADHILSFAADRVAFALQEPEGV
jgi:porphobilinogen synthase